MGIVKKISAAKGPAPNRNISKKNSSQHTAQYGNDWNGPFTGVEPTAVPLVACAVAALAACALQLAACAALAAASLACVAASVARAAASWVRARYAASASR